MEDLKNLYRKIRGERPKPKMMTDAEADAFLEAAHQQTEKQAETYVYYLYINFQGSQAKLAQQIHQQKDQVAQLSWDKAREVFSRRAFDRMQTHTATSNQLLEAMEDELLDIAQIPTGKRLQIKVNALNLAHNFWEERLTQPDITSEERIQGQIRITQIGDRLQKLLPER